MKRVLEIVLFSLVTYGLLTLCSCEKDVLIIEEEFVPTSFEEDPLYGTLNDDSIPEDYIKVFLQDAKNHGIDFPEYEEYNIEIIYYLDPSGSIGGWGGQQCELYDIRLGIGFEWERYKFNGVDKNRPYWPDYIPYSKILLMYHELGHIFGLNHTCIEGHIMSGNDGTGCVGEGQLDLDDNVGIWALRYNSPDYIRNFNRAVDDMFNLVDQNMFECKLGKWY